MAETPQQYSARILGNLGDRDPIDVLATTPGRIEALVRGRSAVDLARRPEPTRWAVAEIVAHLADAEIVGAYRLRMMIATPGLPLQAYDQDRFADALDYRAADVGDSLRTDAAVRASNLRLWRSTDPRWRAAFAVHAERGEESVAHVGRLYAGHDLNHLTQIEAILGAG